MVPAGALPALPWAPMSDPPMWGVRNQVRAHRPSGPWILSCGPFLVCGLRMPVAEPKMDQNGPKRAAEGQFLGF